MVKEGKVSGKEQLDQKIAKRRYKAITRCEGENWFAIANAQEVRKSPSLNIDQKDALSESRTNGLTSAELDSESCQKIQ